MKECIIREVLSDELDACAEVIRLGFGTVARDFGLTAQNCPTNGAFIKAERLVADKNKGCRMYVLLAGDTIAGFMELEQKSAEFFILEKITVLPEYRHHGYGKKLLDHAKSKVKELGGKTIGVGIIEGNTVLKQWYLQNGFVHTGTKKFDTLPFIVGFMEYTIQ